MFSLSGTFSKSRSVGSGSRHRLSFFTLALGVNAKECVHFIGLKFADELLSWKMARTNNTAEAATFGDHGFSRSVGRRKSVAEEFFFLYRPFGIHLFEDALDVPPYLIPIEERLGAEFALQRCHRVEQFLDTHRGTFPSLQW